MNVSRAGLVLVVDDEQCLRDAVGTALGYEGFRVVEADSGRVAMRAVREQAPDVVILDVMLPDIDGIEVCRQLRAAGCDAHVLFLTARNHVANKVSGLGAGGDDYITKPFSLAEVVARVKAMTRRRQMSSPGHLSGAGGPFQPQEAGAHRLVCGDVVLDRESHEVRRGGVPIQLTATEFRLLAYFLENPRRVLSKQQILDAVWDEGFSGTVNVVEAYVGYLRRKLDPHGAPLIETVRLVGYVLHPSRTNAAREATGEATGEAAGEGAREGAKQAAGGEG